MSKATLAVAASLAALAVFIGCQNESPPPAASEVKTTSPPAKSKPPKEPAPQVAQNENPPVPRQPPAPRERPAPPLRQPGGLGDLLTVPAGEEINFHTAAPKPVIDEEKVLAHGIRKLVGKHLILYTDLKSTPEVDELPQVFDLAVPQWRDYFSAPAEKADAWQIWGYVIQDKAKFQAAGLLPGDLPNFPNGYQRGHEFWLYEQPSDYYRRHLFLHEGTHAAMNHWLGGAGPPWYSEGMAELFGTHAWRDGKLMLLYMPKSKEEVPEWGRIKLIKDAYADDRALMLHEVLKLPGDAHRNNEAYAWSWAAAAFFDGHPRYRDEFRKLRERTRDVSLDFTKDFLEHFRDDVVRMQTEWQLFVANNEYGYDVARNAIEPKPVVPLPATGATVEVSAEHGWQSSGFNVEANQTYRLTAQGRYQIAKDPKVWWCEPGGVTIRYHHAQPLGMLLAAVRDDAKPVTPEGLLSPVPIGLGTDFTPKTSGTLWLKINEHDSEWADNEGTLQVNISPPSDGKAVP